MLIMQESLPGINKFFKPVVMNSRARDLAISCIIAFLMHWGKMTATQAAGSVRSRPRHRAQICRFLGRKYWKRFDLLGPVQHTLLELEAVKDGIFIFIVDQTVCSVQAESAENSYHTRNTKKRPQKSGRKQKKHTKRSCHCFVMGLLITPSGYRICYYLPFYTKSYCEARKLKHKSQAELAAELIDKLYLPESAKVVVLGDTAFDAKVIRTACDNKGFSWIVPVNPERVLAGASPRPKVTSLVEKIKPQKLACIKVQSGSGDFVNYRRASRCRTGPKSKPSTYFVHEERQDVHSVGEVRLFFSTIKSPQKGENLKGCKILMTNNLSVSTQKVIELYGLRWQIELFFKEVKSSLGLSHYRVRSFEKVENWVTLCLAAFIYLETLRARKLRQKRKTKENIDWWRLQRTHGLTLAVRQKAEEMELVLISKAMETKSGIKRIKKIIREAYPKEYQARL